MKKFIAQTLFGEMACRKMCSNSIYEAERVSSDFGQVTTREFETEAERQAYYLGVSDSCGWEDFLELRELSEKIDRLSSQIENPSVAYVTIMYADDGNTLSTLISLCDCVPEGYDEDELFYFCSGIDDLKSLCEPDGMEDFVVIGVNSII